MIKRLFIGFIAILILLICGFYVYTLNYYKAQNTAKETVDQSNYYAVKDGSMIIFYPKFQDKDKTAIIFLILLENYYYIFILQQFHTRF